MHHQGFAFVGVLPLLDKIYNAYVTGLGYVAISLKSSSVV